jgi:hypothetical protein
VLEPSEEPPPGRETKDYKYHGNRPNGDGKSYDDRFTRVDMIQIETVSSTMLLVPAKGRSKLCRLPNLHHQNFEHHSQRSP